MEVNAARDDESFVGPECRECREANAVSRVRVDDLDLGTAYQSAKLVNGAGVDLERGRAVDDRESRLACTLRERLTGARRNDGPMSPTRQLDGEPESLSLPAPPPSLGVDVKNAHEIGRDGS
jgi:hypothetical protein